MFLKALKEKFKYKSGLKYLKEQIEKPSGEVARKNGITSVAVIVDLDKFDKAELFYEFVEDFKANAPIWKYDVKNGKRIYAEDRSTPMNGSGLLA